MTDGGATDGGALAGPQGGTDRIGELVGRVPGDAAGVGVAVVAVTLGLLALPVGVTFPGFGFVLIDQAILFVLYAMILLGLNLQFGDTGIINFGPVLFLGLGLYGMALISADPPSFGAGAGLDQFWLLGIGVGVVAAVVGGGLLGVSSIRLREDYLAITTLAAAEILHEVVRVFQTPFGGSKGILGVPQLVVETGSETGVLRLAENAATRDLATLLLLAGGLLVVYEGFRRLSASPYGRVLRAIQADEDAVRSVGKDAFRYKMQAFVYGAAVAGVAGGLMAMYFGSVAPGLITIDVTVIIWIGMMIGGAGNHRGAIAGLAIIMFFELAIRLLNAPVTQELGVSAVRFNALRGLLIGALLMGVIRYRPAGLFGDEEKLEVFK
ncbi:MAG: branched-chain amino acid ABC transporter permease [Haloferacaceae archaeon]